MVGKRKRHCCVLSCRNYYNALREKCYSFPRNKKVAQAWVRALNNPNLDVEEAHNYHRSTYVCHRHFATSQFNTPERLRLNRGTVPTLFLPSSDNSENVLSASHMQKVFLSSLRYRRTHMFANLRYLDEFIFRDASVKEETGSLEELESQVLPHQDSEMHEVEDRSVRDLQPLQKDEDRVEIPVHEGAPDNLTENGAAQYHEISGTQADCREPVALGGTAVNVTDVPETCDITSDHGDSDECEDVKFIPNELCTVATETWEDLPNQLCRLCASTDEHPKQSIVGWLGMLNEIIPELVALNDGLPQHICRPCTNKLYTCNKIKADFIEAYSKLEEYLGFTRSPGIQYVASEPAVYDHETLEVTEEEMMSTNVVSEIEEEEVNEAEHHLVSEVEGQSEFLPEGLCRVALVPEKDLLEVNEVSSNTGDDLSMNLEEFPNSITDDDNALHGNFPEDNSSTADNTSGACDMKGQRVKKYKYVCGECEQMFKEKGALNRHRLSHATGSVCEYCNKKFTSTLQLDDHRRIHTKELPFMCEVCGKCFRNLARLKQHELVHKPPSYTCEVCNNKFRSRMYLTQHKKVHSADTKLMCELCGKILYTVASLQIHLRIHTGEKPFQCDVCGKCFISAGRLRHHGFVHADSKFRCDTCGKEFIFKKSLAQHQKCHMKLKQYRCPICFREFSNSQSRRRHLKVNCNKRICIVCNEVFLTDELVEEHRTKEHTQEEVTLAAKSYNRQRYFKTCPLCAQTIFGRRNMLKHMKEHHSDYNYKPFACELCTKTFSTASALRTHRIWHSEHRSFPCVTCGKRFKTKYTLKWHDLSVHRNEHPFHCPYCDCQFKRLYDLIVHKRKHTGERPFPCAICMQKFFTKRDMLKHAKKHSQSKANAAWKEAVEVTVPVNEIVFLPQGLECDVSVVECVD